MSFSAIASRLLKVRQRRGGGVSSYFAGDLAAIEALAADVMSVVGITGRAGDMAALESTADVLAAAGSLPSTAGFDFYISPTGSDSNAGTQAAPWAITALNTRQSAYAGKKVGLLDGTYNVYSLVTPLAYDQYAFTIAGGTSAASTVIKAVNVGKAIITAKSGSSYGGGNSAGPSLIGLLSEYITIDGLVLTGHTRRCICVGGASAILDPSRRGIVIQNCELYDNSGVALGTGLNISQIELNDSLGTIIRNNYFHDNVGYSVGSADHFCAVEVWSSGLGVFEYNTITNQAGAFQGKAQTNDTYSNIFRYNYIDLSSATSAGPPGIFGFNEGTSYQANTGRAATEIYNNVIIAQYPILLRNVYLDTRTTRFFHPVSVRNNTLVVPSGGSVGCTMFVDASVAASHYNNIITRVSGNADLQGMFHMTALLSSLIDYDHLYQTSGAINFITSPAYDGTSRSNWSSLSAFATAMGNNTNGTTVDQHANASNSDPLFAGTGANADYYRLQAGSPCVGTGRSDGTASGTACDKGAWGNGAPSVIGSS